MAASRASLAYVLLAAASVLPFAGSLRHPYLWDDADQIAGNYALRDARSLLRLAGRSYYDVAREESYRPVKFVSLYLSERAFGPGPAAQRAVNAALHAANTLLLWLVARTCLPAGAGLAAALLFAVHPVHSEAVICVSYRDELLALGFSLAAMLLVRRRREGTALAAYALALLSKENAILLPAAVFLRELWARAPEEKTGPPLRFYAGSLLIGAAYLAARLTVLRNPEQTAAYPGGSLYTNFLTMTPILVDYLKLLVWPARLSVGYDLPVLTSATPRFWLAAAVLAALGVAAASLRDRRAAFFSLWAMLGLLPVLNIVPFLGYSLMFERYLYAPSAGFCLLAGLLAGRLPRRALAAAVVLAALAGAARTAGRAGDWRDGLVLYQKDMARFPGSFAIPVFVGRIHLERGDLDAAILLFRKSLALEPSYHSAHNALGVALHGQGDEAAAIREFEAALRSRPRYVAALDNLALAYFESGNPGAAAAAEARALAIKPDAAQARENLAVFALRRDRLGQAVATARSALAEGVHSPGLYAVLGMAFSRQGRHEAAVRALRDALALAPEDSSLHDRLAVAYVAMGALGPAVEEFREAIRLDPSNAQARSNLAVTYARQGLRRQALAEIERYLEGRPPEAKRQAMLRLRARIAGR
ncbi:MAG: tetratricopeptide repeat protein [Elusimicrobia bacterium]|nr:tetratricopeptide repeat protein [Elusimicrobiota bacterium]